jgi:hypothetical protein
MPGFIIEITDIEVVLGQTRYTRFNVLPGSPGILTFGVVAKQLFKNCQRFLSRSLIPVNRIELIKMTETDLIDNIGDGFVFRMQLFKLLIPEDRILIFLAMIIAVGDFQFSEDGILAERITILKLLEQFQSLPVVSVLEFVRPFYYKLIRGLLLCRFKPGASRRKKPDSCEKKKIRIDRFLHILDSIALRARAKTTCHFGISASGDLWPILIRKSLEIACYSVPIPKLFLREP